MVEKRENQKAVAVLSRSGASKRHYSVYAKTDEAEKIKDAWTLLLDYRADACEREQILKGLSPLYGENFKYVGAKEFDLDHVSGRKILIKSLDHVERNGYGLFELSDGELKEWNYDVIEPLEFILKD